MLSGRKRKWFTVEDALEQLSLHKPVQLAYLQSLLNCRNKVTWTVPDVILHNVCVCVSVSVGFPEWIAQFCVWNTTGKDSSEACAIACQNCVVYSVFPSDMTSQSTIAQFDWECIAPFIEHLTDWFCITEVESVYCAVRTASIYKTDYV